MATNRILLVACRGFALKTKVTNVQATPDGLVASFEGGKGPPSDTFDRVLVAVVGDIFDQPRRRQGATAFSTPS
jgi:hypothetical protein